MKLRYLFKTWICIIFILFCLVAMAHAAILYQATNSVTLAWDDDQTDIDHYEVILIRDGTSVEYGPYATTTKTITITRPKSGIYEVRVRGVRGDQTSTWHSSLDDNAQLVDGTAGSWKVSFKPLGPTGPVIIE